METRKIEVDISEAYRYLGGKGTQEASIADELKKAARLVEENAHPLFIEKRCELERNGEILLKGTSLRLEGKSISALLHDCESCILFCATVGNDLDALIRKWQLKDMSFAAMLDACASSAVESLCNSVEAQLREEYGAEGLYLTDRFSPGYGDFPLDIQPELCAVLDTARKIGVVVSESLLMTPRKSVTAIIGLSKNPQRHFENGCRDCLLINSCKFRETGVTCYGRAI